MYARVSNSNPSSASSDSVIKQAVVRKHNKPRPCAAHRGIVQFLRTDQKCNQVVPWSLHILWKFHANRSGSLLVMLTNDEKEISIARFLRIDPKIEWGRPMVTPHLPGKFHANRSSRFLVILLTKKQRYKQTKKERNKEIDRKQYPVPRCIGDGVITLSVQCQHSIDCQSRKTLYTDHAVKLSNRTVQFLRNWINSNRFAKWIEWNWLNSNLKCTTSDVIRLT